MKQLTNVRFRMSSKAKLSTQKNSLHNPQKGSLKYYVLKLYTDIIFPGITYLQECKNYHIILRKNSRTEVLILLAEPTSG